MATYADKKYYSTTGSAIKNIHINYPSSNGFTNLYGSSTRYCSQLVYLSYYYGTGNLPVMSTYANTRIISPYGLPNDFQQYYNSHRATLVKEYKF